MRRSEHQGCWEVFFVVPPWPLPVSDRQLQACVRPLIAKFSPAGAGLSSASTGQNRQHKCFTSALLTRAFKTHLETGDEVCATAEESGHAASHTAERRRYHGHHTTSLASPRPPLSLHLRRVHLPWPYSGEKVAPRNVGMVRQKVALERWTDTRRSRRALCAPRHFPEPR
jgi:hypothetical protein